MLMLVLMAHRHLREEPYCWPERRRNRLHDEEMSRDTNSKIGFGVRGFVDILFCWLRLLEPVPKLFRNKIPREELLSSPIPREPTIVSREYFIHLQDVRSSSHERNDISQPGQGIGRSRKSCAGLCSTQKQTPKPLPLMKATGIARLPSLCLTYVCHLPSVCTFRFEWVDRPHTPPSARTRQKES